MAPHSKGKVRHGKTSQRQSRAKQGKAWQSKGKARYNIATAKQGRAKQGEATAQHGEATARQSKWLLEKGRIYHETNRTPPPILRAADKRQRETEGQAQEQTEKEGEKVTDNGEQLAFFDIAEPQKAKGKTKTDFTDYEGFVEKFKPKKTTDDCYTPPIVYDAIADWVAAEYGVSRADFVRPFYPGWDYQAFGYTGKVVVDNPPFSILGQIVSYYDMTGVKFFLFAPQLTGMAHACKNCCYIYTDCAITYENGAVIKTAFLTNLEPHEILIKTSPELTEIVDAANDRARKQSKPPELPKYKYPLEVISVQLVSALARHGIPITIKRNECYFIRELDSQKRQGKTLFGGGFLTTRAKGAELEEARRQAEEARRQAEEARRQVWELSPRELKIIKELEERQRDI